MSIDTATGKEAPAEISSERVKDIFSSIAKKYERFNAVSSFGAYKSWLAGMMRQAPIEPTDDVLDIAGGTGDVTFTVARAKHPRHIQCTDLVNEMLDVARAHYADGAACGVPVDFEVVDAQNIPYADASYDALTMAYGIRNMPDRPRALSEMFRVLKPGGHLVCLEFSTPPNAVWRALYNFYLKHLIPFWGGLITGDKAGFVYRSSMRGPRFISAGARCPCKAPLKAAPFRLSGLSERHRPQRTVRTGQLAQPDFYLPPSRLLSLQWSESFSSRLMSSALSSSERTENSCSLYFVRSREQRRASFLPSSESETITERRSFSLGVRSTRPARSRRAICSESVAARTFMTSASSRWLTGPVFNNADRVPERPPDRFPRWTATCAQ